MISPGTAPALSDQGRVYLGLVPVRSPLWERGVVRARREMREDALAVAGEPEPVRSVEDVVAGGVGARLYRPFGDERSVLVWLHAGAWILGDLESYDAVARALANRAGCAVLSVDYRLAPEHPYPAALDDCWAATVWASGQFERVAVGGDSAGGNLAAAVSLQARDRRLDLVMQVLVYPVLDYAALEGAFCTDYVRRYEGFAGARNFGAARVAGVRFSGRRMYPTHASIGPVRLTAPGEVARRSRPNGAHHNRTRHPAGRS